MNKGAKILIADNSLEIGVFCENILTCEGHEVKLTTKDGEAVLNLANQFKPDIVVMESFMPNKDAVGIMKAISESGDYESKFIVISNYNSKFVEKEVMENGASYYIVKPFDARALCDRILSLASDYTNEKPMGNSKNNKDKNSSNLEEMITEVILDIGVPAHV
ncbi:MAG: response regulator, partial [Oscillospiraceae bacterium]